MPNLPTRPGVLGEGAGRRWGWRAGFSVRLRRGIPFIIIATVLLWGGIIVLVRALFQ
jgi:hypothetical protein